MPTFDLYLGDCLDFLRTLPAGSVDAVITDPPYGIGWDRGTWDDDPALYTELMCAVVAESNRLTAGGPVFMWQALLNIHRFHEWFPDGFRVMAACKGFVQYRPTPVQWSWDPVVFWGDFRGIDPSVYRKDFHVNNLAPFGAFRESIDHPSPKALPSVLYVLELATSSGATVLDPFMGSGTTGVACMQTGRNFIGCEIDAGYFAIAKKRIEDAAAQLPLIPHEVQTPHEQMSMEVDDETPRPR